MGIIETPESQLFTNPFNINPSLIQETHELWIKKDTG